MYSCDIDFRISAQQKALEKGLRQERQEGEAYWAATDVTKKPMSRGDYQTKIDKMVTKHDEDECVARNAERLMNAKFADRLAGDMSSVRMSNKAYNSFKRSVERLRVRSERKVTGGRRTRANFAKMVSSTAARAALETDLHLSPGSVCMARTEDGEWHQAQVMGLSTTLPRRYKVRFVDLAIDEFVPVTDVREMDEDDIREEDYDERKEGHDSTEVAEEKKEASDNPVQESRVADPEATQSVATLEKKDSADSS